MKNNIFFVSGTGTGIGKSYATGYLAREWNRNGIRTITQKLIQTGNHNISEDIELHRKIMGLPLLKEDLEGLTMPEIFSYPASPHLAAKIDKREIDFKKIKEATAALSHIYDRVLVEGAGGLMVPLKGEFLTIDYIKQENYPLILVGSAQLGSINHILLSLEAVAARGIELYAFIYNHYQEGERDDIIKEDTREYISEYLKKHFSNSLFIEIPLLDVSGI